MCKVKAPHGCSKFISAITNKLKIEKNMNSEKANDLQTTTAVTKQVRKNQYISETIYKRKKQNQETNNI